MMPSTTRLTAAAKSATVTIKPKRVAVRCIISFPGNYLSDYFPLGHACLCVLQAPFHVVSGFGSNETRDKPRAGSVARLLAFTRSGGRWLHRLVRWFHRYASSCFERLCHCGQQ